MWPFSSGSPSLEERIEQCDHDFDEVIRETVPTHGSVLFDEDKKPYIDRVTAEVKYCSNCPEGEVIEKETERVYLSIESVEELDG